jgi:membrane-associated phospholipid phosphatase
MQVRFALPAALLISLSPALAPAQSVGEMVRNDVKNFGGDVWSVWTSPFRAGPKDWMNAGLAVAVSAGVSTFDDDVDRWMVRNEGNAAWSALKEVREGGHAFSGKYIAPVAAATLVYGLAAKNTKVQEGLFGCLASYTAGSVVRNYVFYYAVGRERPDSSRDDATTSPAADEGDQYHFTFPGTKDWGMHSLPAGHAANIMACATYLNTRFDMGLAEPLLYAVTAGIGTGRLVDRRHWTSDTVLGLVFGYAVGREVAKRSLARSEKASAISSGMSGAYLTPSKGGITLGWSRTF